MSITVQEIQVKLLQQLHRSSETASLDIQVILAHYLEQPRSWILAHPEAFLTRMQCDNIYRAVERLTQGEPLPYIIGHWEFFGLDFHLTPAVLIPRPETELLVERAISWLNLHPARRHAIDVGTGSGSIGISLAKTIPDLHMLLTDISLEALNVAQENAKIHGLTNRLVFMQVNLLDGISSPFDLICANLPYIPTALLMTLPVFRKEPRSALDGGLNGTVLIGKLLEQARNQLLCGGLLLLEIESTQGENVNALAHHNFPLSDVHIFKDLSGQDRCLEIERPSLLVHICPRLEWLHAQNNSLYRDASLEQDGYIHCSQPEQVLWVANQFYLGASDIILLWLDPEKLAAELRWENVDGTFFPHIYGPINLDAVSSISDLKTDTDGIYRSIQLPG